MERMAYLVQIGFVMQVMTYIEKNLSRLDEKLVTIFIKKVISACGPPYSEEFYISMLKLIEYARVQLDSQLDTRPMIVQFFADRPQTIDHKYHEFINNLAIAFCS